MEEQGLAYFAEGMSKVKSIQPAGRNCSTNMRHRRTTAALWHGTARARHLPTEQGLRAEGTAGHRAARAVVRIVCFEFSALNWRPGETKFLMPSRPCSWPSTSGIQHLIQQRPPVVAVALPCRYCDQNRHQSTLHSPSKTTPTAVCDRPTAIGHLSL